MIKKIQKRCQGIRLVPNGIAHFECKFLKGIKIRTKHHNIIISFLPAYPFLFPWPLDFECDGVLRRLYSLELEVFVKALLNIINQVEFFIAFRNMFPAILTENNR